MFRLAVFLLGLWGLLNLLGGFTQARNHPSPIVAPLFVLIGMAIIASAVSIWLHRAWGLYLAVVALLALSVSALYSGVVLHGWSGIHISHHVVRLVVSLVIIGMIVLGWRGR